MFLKCLYFNLHFFQRECKHHTIKYTISPTNRVGFSQRRITPPVCSHASCLCDATELKSQPFDKWNLKNKRKKHIALWSASNSTMRSVENSRFIHIYPSFFKKSYWCQISIITNGYSSCCCCVNFVVIFRPSAISI